MTVLISLDAVLFWTDFCGVTMVVWLCHEIWMNYLRNLITKNRVNDIGSMITQFVARRRVFGRS